jgi:energy-coupling factor transporter ATP-binding protein EcfA2
MQKIKSITLRNFKYFYGKETEHSQNKIELDKNNLLLYGENGSGKSSIYWALYTFLQSAIKDPRSEIEKYFDPNHNQNIRNRFALPDEESGIIVEFTSPSGGTIKELKRNTDRTYSINTYRDTFTEKALIGSDFINYKFLSKIYDFRNSEHIDLFEMFERDILMFIDFEEAYTEHDGTLSTKTYASDWWKFICEAPTVLPYNGNIVSVGSDEYKRFKNTTIPKFVQLLKKLLLDITQGANEYLENQFNEDFTISFDTESISCEYNKKVSQRAKDGKLLKPSIPLKVHFNHNSLAEVNKQILKPHTFLNEARLTAIALAIRLSILDRKLKDPNSARILVLDDLLLSLDMSHRDRVLEILLSDSFIDTYQILLLTHDRAFYNMCKNRIQDRFETGWVFKEMYQHQTVAGIPCPFIPDQSNYLDLAKKYLKDFDYPASANYLRKEAERLFKYLLPKNLCLYFKEDKGMVTLQLDNLISNFLKYFSELGGNIEPFKKLKEHKDLLLNPLSHDNTESPIYRKELDNIIEILDRLNQLKVYTIGLPDFEDLLPFELHEIDSSGDVWQYSFFTKETFRALRDLNNQWYISNPECHFISRKNVTKNLQLNDLGNTIKLEQGYGNIRHALGIKTKDVDNKKDLKEIVYKDGQKLINKLDA